MDTNTQPSSFDQELNTKVNELEIQRKLREGRSVELTLSTILDRVQPRQDAVSNILSKSRSIPRDLRELLWHEISRAAEGDLLCTAYRERRKSEQRVIAYTGCCWEMIDQQLWSEDCGKTLFQLLGDGDFGNEIEHVPALPQLFGGQPDIDFGLAAARDSVQEHGFVLGKALADLFYRGLLGF